jgi:hypothetical protein
VNGVTSRLLAGLLAGPDDAIAAAFLNLSSAQRVRLARLLSAAMEDAIIRHGRQDRAAPAILVIDEVSMITPGVLRRLGQLIREGRQP